MRLLLANLLLLVPLRWAGAQALPAWASVTVEAAAIRLPADWIATPSDSGPWVVSWGKGEELAAWWKPAPHGIEIRVPEGAAQLADRLAHATVRFFWETSCGDPNCILLDSDNCGRAGLDGDAVLITVPPGAALTSLLSVRPDSLRLDGPARREPFRPVGWMRVTYGR